MKVLYDFTIKNLKTNKKRTIVTIIGIILSCALLFSVGFFASTYRHNLIKEAIRNFGTHHIEYYNQEYSKIDIIKNDYDVKDFLVKMNHIISGTITTDEYTSQVNVSSIDMNYHEILDIIEGRTPENHNEVLISKNYANIHKIKINENISIKKINDEEVEYKVVGIYKSKKTNYDKIIYGIETLFTNFIANEDSLVNVYVTLSSPKDGIAKLNLLTNKLGKPFPDLTFYTGNKDLLVNTTLLALYGESADAGVMAVIYLSIMLISAILSIVCILIIYNSFSISVTERKRQFGILSSIGATPMQILYSVLFEAIIVSIIAVPLSFILSIIGVYLILTVLNILLDGMIVDPLTLSIYPYFILLSLTFILITIFLSALFPAVRASEIYPVEAIRLSKDIKIKRKKIKTNKLIFKLFGIEGSLAYKNMKRQKSKYRITVISIVTSIVLFITAATYINTAIKALKEHYEYYPNYDVYISINSSENQLEFANKIKNIKEVKEAIEYKYQDVYIKLPDEKFIVEEYLEFINFDGIVNERNYTITILLLNDSNYQEYKKRIGLKNDQPILVNYGIYSNWNKITDETKSYAGPVYKESKNLTLTLCNYETSLMQIDIKKMKDCYFELSNFYFTNIRPINSIFPSNIIIIVNEQIYQEIEQKKEKNDMLASSDNNINLELKIKNAKIFDEEFYNLKFEGSCGYSNYKLYNHQQKMQLWAVMFALYSFIAFIALIAITSIINTINTSINLRKIEFAVLKSVGQSPKSFNKMILFESLFLGIKALIYGLIISFGIIYVIMQIADLSYGENKIKIPFPTIPVIICIFVVFIITIITMKYSTNKLKKENIIDTIRNENI